MSNSREQQGRGEQGSVSMILRAAAGVFLFLAGAASLLIHEGYVWAPAGLILLGLLVCGRVRSLPTEALPLLVGLAAFGVYSALLSYWHDGLGKPVWGYLSYTLCWLIALAVWVLKPSPGWWFSGAAFGAIMAACWAIWQKLTLGVDRATGHIYVILFGNIGLLLGVVSLLGVLYFQSHPKCVWRTRLFLLGATSGALVSILSGTRGGWVGVPVLLWVLWQAFSPFLGDRQKLATVMLFSISAVFVVALPQTGVLDRLTQMKDELILHTHDKEPGPSLGQRFVMWSWGIEMVSEKPFLGWGAQGYRDERDRRMDEGSLVLLERFHHVHNEILDVSVKRGVPAGMLALVVLLLPILLFRRDSQSPDPAIRALATAGIVLPFLALDFGLSALFIESKSGRYIYFGWLPMIYALYANARYQPSHSGRSVS